MIDRKTTITTDRGGKIKHPHKFIEDCKFLAISAQASDSMQESEDVIDIDCAKKLADEIVRLRKEHHRMSMEILNGRKM